jgi:nucleotide-binding universal stress UspA family protein
MHSVPTFLVAVDFSEGSNKAVEYAVCLARTMLGRVELVHIADADEIAESHNQMVVLRSINRALDKARARLQSYQEMISQKWQVTTGQSVDIGKVHDRLPAVIAKANPDVVFLGKNHSNSRRLRSLLKRIESPVVVVPAEVVIRSPRAVVLAADLGPLDRELIKPLLNLSGKDSHVLRLLHVARYNGRNGVNLEKESANFSQKLKVNTELIYRKDYSTISGVRHFLVSGNTDLMCTVRRRRNFLKELFSAGTSIQLALHAPIPTLILTERVPN